MRRVVGRGCSSNTVYNTDFSRYAFLNGVLEPILMAEVLR